MKIDEIRNLERIVPEDDQMFFIEAIEIIENENEITRIINLAYSLGYARGKGVVNSEVVE